MDFVPARWLRLIRRDGAIDSKLYELCVFSRLRDAPRAGDVWIDGSSRYRRFEHRLLAPILRNTVYPAAAAEALRRSGVDVPDELLRHLWPLGRDHVSLTGDDRWSADNPKSPGQATLAAPGPRARHRSGDPGPGPAPPRQQASPHRPWRAAAGGLGDTA